MQVQGSDYVDYEEAIQVGMNLIEENRNANLGLLIVCGVNMGLRIGDLLNLTYEQLHKVKFVIKEQKTKKMRKVVANSIVLEAVGKMPDTPAKQLGGKVFTTRLGTTYSRQYINRQLKKYFDTSDRKISTHSLRKSFGRRWYTKQQEKGVKDGGLARLQLQLNHSSPQVTLRYIGVTQESLDDMYDDLI